MRRTITSIIMIVTIVFAVSVTAEGQSEPLSLQQRSSMLGKLATAAHISKVTPTTVDVKVRPGVNIQNTPRFRPSNFGFKAGLLIGGAIGCLSTIDSWAPGSLGGVVDHLTMYDPYRTVMKNGLIGAAVGGLSGFLVGELVEVVTRRR
jgi:hypothetical protein